MTKEQTGSAWDTELPTELPELPALPAEDSGDDNGILGTLTAEIDLVLREHALHLHEHLETWLIQQEQRAIDAQRSIECMLRDAITPSSSSDSSPGDVLKAAETTESPGHQRRGKVDMKLPGTVESPEPKLPGTVDSPLPPEVGLDGLMRPPPNISPPAPGSDGSFPSPLPLLEKSTEEDIEVVFFDSSIKSILGSCAPADLASLPSAIQSSLDDQENWHRNCLQKWSSRQDRLRQQAHHRVEVLLKSPMIILNGKAVAEGGSFASTNDDEELMDVLDAKQLVAIDETTGGARTSNMSRKTRDSAFSRNSLRSNGSDGGQRNSDEESIHSEIIEEQTTKFMPDRETNSLKRCCFLLLEDSSNYVLGRFISGFMLFAIVISTVSFVLESMPTFQERRPECQELINSGQPITVTACEPVALETFAYLEAMCIIVFTVEFLVRMAFCHTEPNLGPTALQRTFWYSLLPLNVIDVAAVAPWYLGLFLGTEAVSAVRMLRLCRVFRLFKLAKHNHGIMVCVEAVMNSGLPLAILMFFNVLSGVILASVVYYFEGLQGYSVDPSITGNSIDDTGAVSLGLFPTGAYVRWDAFGDSQEVTPFKSIPLALWWVFTTTTTVGYGDMVPTSPGGKIIGVFCFYTGIIFLALPIGVISSNFEIAYDKEQARLRRLRAARIGLTGSDHKELQANQSLFAISRDRGYPIPLIPAEEGIRKKIWYSFGDAASSILAKYVSFFMTAVILVTTGAMLLESIPSFSYQDEACDVLNLTVSDCKPRPAREFYLVELTCIILFTIDYIGRVGTCHDIDPRDLGIEVPHGSEPPSPMRRTWLYATQGLNVVDFLAIVPFYLEMAGLSGMSSSVLRVLRLVRVFRLLKSPKLRSCVDMIIHIVSEALPGIVSVFSLTILVCILFASFIYFAEGSYYSVDYDPEEYPYGVYIRPSKTGIGDEPSPFLSIFHCFWWFFTTATTVGYGDDYPTTTSGKVIAVMVYYSGIVLVAIKLTIIGGAFRKHYPVWHAQC